jgi:hypothetical protein
MSSSSWNNNKKWSSIRNDHNDKGTCSRRQTTIQIRKQRKEDMLRRKRGIQSSTRISVQGSITDSLVINQWDEKLHGVIDQYCMNHPSRNHLVDGNNIDVRHPIILLYESFTTIPHTNIVYTLEQCIRSNNVLYGNRFFQNLIYDVQIVEYAEMAAIIFVEITSIHFSTLSKTTNNDLSAIDDDSNYYGPNIISNNRLPYWYELFRTTDPMKTNNVQTAYEYTLLPTLIQIINAETTSINVVELLCNMLGNVVLQQWDGSNTNTNSTINRKNQQPTMTFMEELVTPTNWSILIHKLPYSCYCCSCIIRVDTIHYAMDFLSPLQQNNNNKNNNSFTNDTFSKLLLDNERCVETVWMLEGLTRREIQAVDVLFSIPNDNNASTPSTTQLSLQLIQQIHNHTVALTVTSDSESHHQNTTKNENLSKYFLVPALRTIANIAVAFEEQHHFVKFLQQPLLIISINYLLEERMLIDAIYTANTLLYMVCRTESVLIETRNEPLSTLMRNLIRNFIPRLVHIVTNHSNPSEWRRESMLCIVDVVIDYCTIYDISQSIVQEYVWHTDFPSNHHHHTSLMQSLLDMLKGNDNDIINSTMKLTNRLLRTISESRKFFMNLNGVEKLEDICSTTNTTYDEHTQELAVQLLEEYFDYDNDDIDDIESDMNQNGTVIEQTSKVNEFSFGVPSSTYVATGSSIGSSYMSDMSFQQEQQPPTVGRGRGRVIPAWMAQQQH